jgi:hypothetical protein
MYREHRRANFRFRVIQRGVWGDKVEGILYMAMNIFERL